MYSVSSAFLTALRSTSMVSGVQIVASDGTVLSASTGSVSMDRRRSITRTAQLDLTATSSKTVAQIYDLVMTPNIEITISRGLKLASGSFEYVPLGVFSTDEAILERSTSGQVKWSGSDRSKKIQRSKFIDTYSIASGTLLATAGTALIQSRFAGAPCNFSNVTETVTAQVIYEAGSSSDPWTQARKLFADYGYDLNFDGLGVCRAIKVNDPSGSTPDFDFGSGSTNLVISAETSGTLEKTYNGVIATGEGTGIAVPIRAEVWDTDPNSPTYWLGGFGKVPLFFSSPLLTTAAIAQNAATFLLACLKGKSETLSWPAIVNPALEPLDTVSVVVKGSTFKLVIDQLTIPLEASETMTATGRQTST